uniref:Uncharacterized protein n=1 Tax=Rhizophora mucronata TaxID=61149 RepID=A0A2P2NYQ1_RHIMU
MNIEKRERESEVQKCNSKCITQNLISVCREDVWLIKAKKAFHRQVQSFCLFLGQSISKLRNQ